ncbi:MAG: substrate-binding domain-containing protein [Desulfobacterales bacterium]|nr:substrate-binding domain-containing protein [Desulfobacterales bacterium]
MKPTSVLPIVWSLIFFIFFCGTGFGQNQAPLRGEPFSDPSVTTRMPEKWKEAPITYKPGAEDADITIDLNQQLYSFLLPMVNKYAKENNLKISYSKGTCGKSFGMLNSKKIDIGGACCPPAALDRLPGLKFHTIGIMALALLTHPDNPVDDISLNQARDIFREKTTNWSGVGGPDQPIRPVSSFHCRMRPGHWRLLLDNEELFGVNVLEVGEMSDMIYHIAGNPWTIGYEVVLVADLFQDRGKVKPLKINGYSPRDPQALLNGSYPLYRTFSMTTWEGEQVENPEADKLVAYLLRQMEANGGQYGLVTANRLKKAGWQFSSNELTGEPNLN